MFALTNKPDMAARLYADLVDMASVPGKGTDIMKLLQHMAGVMVETYMVFEDPAAAMHESFAKLAELLGAAPTKARLGAHTLPPAHIMDYETERGRQAARQFFEDWLDCTHEFHALMLTIIHSVFVRWEEEGQTRAESLRLLYECGRRCMANEIAAQELCDVVIECKIAQDDWTLGDCIAALSAVAGRRLALSLSAESCAVFRGTALPEDLDKLVYVMTQEAVRLGVPAGSDWRFGLAANDIPVSAPVNLIMGIEPHCQSFFKAMRMADQYEQAVACAKAAGRMLAVAAGGERPEMEPTIAKPLAMMAITDTYKSVCLGQKIASC